MTRIYGAGGGGGGKGGGGGGQARTPRTERDSLESRQYASVLDLISEGEIEGLVDGAKSVFLNNTPLQNPDGSYNFKIEGNSLQYRYGTQDPQTQSYIPLGDGIGNPIQVNVTVVKDTPVIRSITNSNVDAVRVTITIPRLEFFAPDGNVYGDEVNPAIEVQYNGGGYNRVVFEIIRGRTANPYQRDYLINLDGAFPVDIKVIRTNEDSENISPNLFNPLVWSSYTEIIREKLRYPNSALIALRLDAEQFNSIPSRAYRIRGIKVAIPSNATVDPTNGRLIYSGIWEDFTFGAAQWCSDPAWILWDLLTSTRYGFGNHISASQLDKSAFYAASQYCSALVPDGFGGEEPRFSCNVNIQTAEEAYKLINDLCSVMRTMPYWSTGALTITQDAPADYAYYFTQANVTEEGFSYQGSSLKTRPNVCVVSYLDLNARDIAYEVVEDAEMIAKYGVVKTEVSAFACTSRGQAYRLGEWLLYSERYEGEIVSFTTSVDAGVMVRPGSLIKIADSVRSGERRGGRVVSATTTAVTVDDATGLSSGGVLNVILPDGTVEQRGGATVAGNVITVPTAFSVAPANNAIWLYGTTDVQTSTWRVLSVQEQDGVNYAISAIAYNSSKYDYIERGTPLQRRDITNLNIAPSAPENTSYRETLYEANGLAKSKIIISWGIVSTASQYKVEWRYENNNWNTIFTPSTDYEILDTSPGNYQVNIYSIGKSLLSSPNAAFLDINAEAKASAPETPTGINLVPNSESTAILSWDRALALDVLLGGKVLIRHSNLLTGATWQGSQSIIAAAAGSQTQKQVPLLEGTYLIKFEDDTGNKSTTPATVVADLPSPQNRLLIENHYEDSRYLVFVDDMGDWNSLGLIDGISSGFPGTKTNMVYDGAINALKLTDTSLLSGEYIFKDTFDLGGVFDVNLRRLIKSSGYLPSSLWDSNTSRIDTWSDIDGDSADATDVLMYVRATKNDPNATPTWGEWNEMTNALIRGRGLQFKIIATTQNADQNVRVDELGYVMEIQQRIEQGSLQNTTTGGAYTVAFAQPFYEPPAVGITAFTQFASDLLEITEVTRTGFKLEFRQNGETVSRSFTHTAVGHGKEIL